MFLDIGTDSSNNPVLTANFPYPNLECTVNLKCTSDSSISSNIIASSYDLSNTWP